MTLSFLRPCSNNSIVPALLRSSWHFWLYAVGIQLNFCCLLHADELSEAQVNDCQPIAKLLAVARVFASTTTAALFLFRVSAVYSNKKAIVALFCSLWLALVGVYIIDNIHITKGYAHIPGTKYCIQLNKLDAMAALSNAIYDTLIYLAISWRMASFSVVGHNWTARIKSFFRGDGLLDLSKSLLRSGQIYYLWDFLCFYTTPSII